jgi:2-amino-4-hydroxy-6-hydroxymethyldihydropteridine diphosphokinase
MTGEKIVYLGLGSNLGDREQNIKAALKSLAEKNGLKLLRSSSIAETKPLGQKLQPDYLNCVAEIQTSLSPQQLLEVLKKIESLSGRERTGQVWASRIIDIDIVMFGSEVVKTAELTIPHKSMHLRSFVLAGLCELAPEAVHPLLGEKIYVLYQRLNGENFHIDSRLPRLISVAGIIGAGKSTLAKGLADACDFRLIKEAYDTNPFMRDVYAGKKEYALDSQLYFFLSRMEQLKLHNFKNGKIAVSDYIMNQEIVYAKIWLDKIQFELYKKINIEMSGLAIEPMVVIYLKASAEECLNRIHLRNRPYEQGIDIKFLERLCGEYEKVFADFKTCPVITIDADKCDFRRNEEVEKISSQLKYYTNCT